MRTWPPPTLSQRLDALPRPVFVALLLALLLIAGAWAWRMRPQPIAGVEHPGTRDADTVPGTVESAILTAASIELPSTALTVSLYDELFPLAPPTQPQAQPPPPLKLDVVLVAITAQPNSSSDKSASERVAFVRVSATHEYLSLRTGDRTPAGAIVRAVDPEGVLFAIGGREARLELEP